MLQSPRRCLYLWVRQLLFPNHKRKASIVDRKASIVDNAPDHGLRYALEAIDAQHNLSLSKNLQSLEKFTDAIELDAGDNLNYAGSEQPKGR